jgi:hypothetical protein
MWMALCIGFLKTDNNYTNMTTKTVQKGRHNFTPFHVPRIFGTKGNGVGCHIIALKSCWFDWGEDMDREDFNLKFFGVCPIFERANKNGLMIAGRPKAGCPGIIQAGIYSNKNFAHELLSPLAEIRCSDDSREVDYITAHFDLTADGFLRCSMGVFDRMTQNPIFSATAAKPAKGLHRTFLGWFGGANNSEGPFGGVASQKVEFKADIFSGFPYLENQE